MLVSNKNIYVGCALTGAISVNLLFHEGFKSALPFILLTVFGLALASLLRPPA